MNVKEYITKHCIYPDFPCKDVNFIDIFPLIRKFAFSDFANSNIVGEPVVFVPEARGFLFYGAIGPSRIIPLRKEGKLPGDLIEIEYQKEYGADKLYFQKSYLERITSEWLYKDIKIPVCFFDDVMATAGTAEGVIKKINELEYNGYRFEVTTAAFYIEIASLKGRERLHKVFPNMNIKTTYTY